jgi:hypothetical protein
MLFHTAGQHTATKPLSLAFLGNAETTVSCTHFIMAQDHLCHVDDSSVEFGAVSKTAL